MQNIHLIIKHDQTFGIEVKAFASYHLALNHVVTIAKGIDEHAPEDDTVEGVVKDINDSEQFYTLYYEVEELVTELTREDFKPKNIYLVDGKPFDRAPLRFERLEFEHDGDVCLLVFENYNTGETVMIDEGFLHTYDIEVLK